GRVAHHGEGREDRAAHDVAQHDDGDGVPEPEVEHDAQRAERPVDRRDVRSSPDPHLLEPGGVLIRLGNGFYAVDVDPELGPGVSRHDCPHPLSVSVRSLLGMAPRYCAGQEDAVKTTSQADACPCRRSPGAGETKAYRMMRS